jgi:alpha-galactosidase
MSPQSTSEHNPADKALSAGSSQGELMKEYVPTSTANEHVRRFANEWIASVCGRPDSEMVRVSLRRQSWGAMRMGSTVVGNPLKLGDKIYDYGLGTHADSDIVIHTGKGIRRLRADVGVDNNPGLDNYNATHPDRLEFALVAGGRTLWTSRRVGIANPLHVDVAVPDVTELILTVRAANGNINAAHANWAGLEVDLADGTTRRIGEKIPLSVVPVPEAMPVTFLLDGKPLRDLLPTWRFNALPETTKDGITTHPMTWTDPISGLELRLDLLSFADFPAIEWVAWLRNTGKSDTPLIENIQAMDVLWATPGDPQVLRSRGSGGSPNDFQYQADPLASTNSLRMAPSGGRSSNVWLPFFNLDGGGEGVICAIGWTGQWAAEIARDDNNRVRMRAGMEKTSLKLHPGEEIRTPRILLLPWAGESISGHNELRRFIIAHHTPHPGGRQIIAPFTMGEWGATPTKDQLANIALWKRERMAYEYYWIDAGWYGPSEAWRPDEISNAWGSQVGNWYACPYAHPNGMKPISDAAHAAGKKFLLWIEPERAVTGTMIDKDHPDWLIGDRSPYVSRLFNLGNPEACAWLTDFISGLIDKYGIDLYRQDFNFDPLPYWQSADAPDRQGMTEIRYVMGLYAFWDGLLARHPDLIIDNCASGGRRLDLETIGRSIPLWRSDYQCSAQSPDGAQTHTLGLSYWLPLHGTGVAGGWTRAGDTYNFRSHLSAALSFGGLPAREEATHPEFDWNWQRRMGNDYLRARPYFYGDYYPLTDSSPDPRQWGAMQMNRADLGEGLVLALRRQQSAFVTASFLLRGLNDDAEYELQDADSGAVTRCSGRSLRETGLTITMEHPRQSRLVFYRKVK